MSSVKAAIAEPARKPAVDVPEAYFMLPHLVERMHRRYLDVLRFELTRLGIADINPVQMMQLLNIDDEVSVQELVDRGHYVGSSAFYNIKKLVQSGYIEQSRAPNDRRAVRVKLTKKGQALVARLRDAQEELGAVFMRLEGKTSDLEATHKALRALERSWDDYLRYGKY